MAQDATFETVSSQDAENIKMKDRFNPNFDSQESKEGNSKNSPNKKNEAYMSDINNPSSLTKIATNSHSNTNNQKLFSSPVVKRNKI